LQRYLQADSSIIITAARCSSEALARWIIKRRPFALSPGEEDIKQGYKISLTHVSGGPA
jgi:hypothetical protein